MKRPYPRLIIAALIILIVFSGCERKKSVAPPTAQGIGTMQAYATATAIAKTETAVSGGMEETEPAEESEQPPETATEEAQEIQDGTEVPAPTATSQAGPTPTLKPVKTYEVPGSYTIHEGEFVYCLARRFDINPEDLLAANGLGLNVTLYPGQTIQIPFNPRPYPGKRALINHPTTYTVKAGDTFYSIACDFGDVDPRAIADANNMTVKDSLKAGQTIQIP